MALLIFHKVNDVCHWALWEISEEENPLREALPSHPEEDAYFETISHPDKRKEFLAARLTVQALLQERGQSYQGLLKDKYDKPFLNHPPYYVSISHTHNAAVAILHEQAVGIDIEPKRDKLWRIAHKFLAPSEKIFVGDSLDKLTLIWSAKEALYKLYGKKKLSFKENMCCQTFEPNSEGAFLMNLSVKNKPLVSYPVFYQEWEGSYIVYVLDLP